MKLRVLFKNWGVSLKGSFSRHWEKLFILPLVVLLLSWGVIIYFNFLYFFGALELIDLNFPLYFHIFIIVGTLIVFSLCVSLVTPGCLW